ncbi:MAG: hypothetical protein A2W33_05745 [Chloroflexi bacterium RBG_16_52_11]|nr:MAG: hypothetical protein A2W33_05745 [Chloroflexi bacterium RBG_16_52_11]
MSLISIVVPVYNNASSLADLLEKFQVVAAQNAEDAFEFIFVNDGSVDDSVSVLQDLLHREARLRLVLLSRNFGSNAAILAGMSQVSGDAIIAIAADLQDPPELIGEMLSMWRDGQKVVLAARKSRDDGLIADAFSNAFYALFRRFAIKTMPRHGFDFFLIDRQVCNWISHIQENNAYLMGLILWLGFEPKVIYYDRKKREKKYGRSMWTQAKKIKYFIDSFVSFSYIPIRAASIIGICLSFLGLIYAIAVIILRMILQIKVEGWASLMIVVLILSGSQMLMLGIIGEYMWRNLEETRRRPRYIISDVIQASPSEKTVE